MEKWFISKKKADFVRIGETFGIDPVIARLIRNRDITGEEDIRRYLSGTLSDISDPFMMKDAGKLNRQRGNAGTECRIICIDLRR